MNDVAHLKTIGKRDSGSSRQGPTTEKADRKEAVPQKGAQNQADEQKGQANPSQSGEEATQKGRQFFRKPIVLVSLGVIFAVLIAAGILWWLQARKYEDTDDAFIDTHMVRVSSEIAGRVTEVPIQDNQLVHAGDSLVDIDSADPQSRVNQALAQTAQAETALGQARAQVQALEANHQQALAAASAAAVQAGNAAREFARYRDLRNLNPAAVAQSQFDQAETQSSNTAAQAAAAVSQARAIEAQRSAAEAQVRGAQAQIDALKAGVSQTQINLGHTHIVAPIDGHIAQRNIAAGNYVSPGQQLLAIIPLQLWVTANFKETQLARMRIGQSVDIQVDACPNAHIRGHIDSIQRGAGQAFGILPPENATGNFVKVVQRVPVKIALDNVPEECPLGPGMSVEPAVKVR